MSQLKVGDKVRTATALTASHWTQNELACRQPEAEGTIVHYYPAGIVDLGRCCVCAQHGCYEVQHNLGCTAYYHGDELTLVTQTEPEPDDKPDGGRLGERVEALEANVHELREIFRDWQQRVVDRLEEMAAKLGQPPAPEPVDRSAAAPRSVLETYRALHKAVTEAKARDCWISQDMGKALHVLEQLGVTPDKPPAPICDDSSLDPPRPVNRCERCGGRPEQHPGEPTCAELRRLWLPLIGPDGYPNADPETLAAAILSDHEDADKLAGIRQELLEAVDCEPDATTDELLARILRRAEAMQHFIETSDPKKLRRAADGMGSLADRGGIARSIAALLNEAAAIFDDELATAGGDD